MTESERRGIDRLVAIVFLTDLAVFVVVGLLFGWLVAGLLAIVSLAGLFVLTLQKLPAGAADG